MTTFLGFIFAVIVTVSLIITVAFFWSGLREGLNTSEFRQLTLAIAIALLSLGTFLHLTTSEKEGKPSQRLIPVITTNQVITTNWVSLPEDSK